MQQPDRSGDSGSSYIQPTTKKPISIMPPSRRETGSGHGNLLELAPKAIPFALALNNQTSAILG